MNQSEAKKPLAHFEDFVHSILQDWKVPGAAVAIIQNDEILLSQGFGQRNRAEGLEVTSETLFPIGSCTKAFTTAAIALLVDEGRLDWDTPVKAYLPSFKLYDTFATERLTPRDLVSHRSGLPRHDLMWYNSTHTRKELFDRLQYLEPNKDLRQLWQYQNLMYMVAGYLVGELTGQTWEEFVQKRIFEPLGMTQSFFSIEQAREQGQCSHPYIHLNDEVKEMAFYAAQGAIAPAGAIVSSIKDMSRWISLQTNGGKIGETQLISEAQIAQMHSPQMVMPETNKYAELTNSTYGMGWFLHTYRGHKMVEHGGNIDGFSSLVTILPQKNIGIVVLTNLQVNPVPSILTYNIIDRLLGLEAVPWNERFRKEFDEMKAAGTKGKEKSEEDRVQGTSPSHPLEAYTGDFEHPGYGTISITEHGGQLKAIFNSMELPLKHYHYDVFDATVEKFDLTIKMSFFTNTRGDIDTLSAPMESAVKDIVFKRVPNKQMTEKSFLEPFTGIYEVMDMQMIVAFKSEHTLSVSMPGQPAFELVPYKGTEFQVKGLSGSRIEFKRDESGTITEAIIIQPGGAITAIKKTK
ncbi:CubicO group peptidase (beta-lactamase class C family) [Thermosporothrix hazakensis]|jgi:CubicO group peptidase (beta-lactamase class C family)|uniref:CubicO group peptidase (Beta-lactamase class C family) n=1 Tax=Thermosporothrix hazakensis TaxID=644383 RepID=A0A326U4N7_THEHA|nr:serine hydrolase [Thermosporothrix hazakensis]PZW26137.1 CubicO group peptidase (beta-lactamase class C family) [Thermosporothrix hazakensis]GCE51397.1 penicillin-binding protein [Thermosporothrix hazakensis]